MSQFSGNQTKLNQSKSTQLRPGRGVNQRGRERRATLWAVVCQSFPSCVLQTFEGSFTPTQLQDKCEVIHFIWFYNYLTGLSPPQPSSHYRYLKHKKLVNSLSRPKLRGCTGPVVTFSSYLTQHGFKNRMTAQLFKNHIVDCFRLAYPLVPGWLGWRGGEEVAQHVGTPLL